MERDDDFDEFIVRAEKFMQQQVLDSFVERKEQNRRYNQRVQHLPHMIESRKKYFKSEKGRLTQKKQYALYHRKVRDHSIKLTFWERRRIQDFYVKCPPGFQVDHIIPLSRGGIHCVANLQYLSSEQNRKKFNNFDINDVLKYIRNKYMRIQIGYVRDLSLRKTVIIEGGIYYCAFQVLGEK